MANITNNPASAARGSRAAGKRPAHRRAASFLGQLRERKVCRAAVAYVLATWLILQLGEILFPALGFPDWTLTLVIVLAALEFPAAMVLAWIFDWTRDGVVVDARERSKESSVDLADHALNIALLLAAVVIAAQLAWPRIDAAPPAPPIDSVVVMPFSEATGADTNLTHGLEQLVRHQLLHASAQLRIAVAGGDAGNPGRDAYPAAASLAVAGTVYVYEDGVRLLVQLIDLETRRYVGSEFVQASAVATPDAQQQLARRAVDAVFGRSTNTPGMTASVDTAAPAPDRAPGAEVVAGSQRPPLAVARRR